jgi:WD40 repeat protein
MDNLNQCIIGLIYHNHNLFYISNIYKQLRSKKLIEVFLTLMSKNNIFIALTGDNFNNNIYDIYSGRLIKQLSGHTNSVICLLNMNNQIIISAGYDKLIKVWKWQINKCIATFNNNEKYISKLLKHNSEIFFSLAFGGTIKKWDLTSLQCINTITVDDHITTIIKVSEYLICGNSDQRILFWDIEFGTNVQMLNNECAANNPLIKINDREIAFSTFNNTIEVWDWVDEYQTKNLADRHTNYISCLLLVKEDILASGGFDTSILIWDLNIETVILTVKLHGNIINGLERLDDRTIISYDTKNVIIWDFKTGCLVKELSDVNRNENIESLIILNNYINYNS